MVEGFRPEKQTQTQTRTLTLTPSFNPNPYYPPFSVGRNYKGKSRYACSLGRWCISDYAGMG